MSFTASFNGTLRTTSIPIEPAASTLSHEKIRLGQIAYVIAREKGLLAAVDVRVTRIERHLKAPENTVITLGDPILLGSDYIQEVERRADWKEKRRRKLDRGRGGQTVTVAHETTSRVPWYARYVVRDGEMLNDVIGDILGLLPDGGGQVVFAEGVYPYDDDIVIDKDNVVIKGQGEGTRFVLEVGTECAVKSFCAKGRTGIGITGLSIDGQRIRQGTEADHCGIDLDSCRQFHISGVTVRDCQSSGIVLKGCAEGRIEGCTLNRNTYNLYAVGGNNLIVAGNNARHSRAEGMSFEDASSLVVTNNLCNETEFYETQFIHGMAFEGCEKATLTGNTCNNNNGYGFWVKRGCKDFIISGNQGSNNRGTGIYVATGDNEPFTERVSIIGNTFSANGGNGIWIFYARRC